MKSIIAVITAHGWELEEIDEWQNMRPLLQAESFEQLMRMAVTGGYLRPPVAIKLGEMPC